MKKLMILAERMDLSVTQILQMIFLNPGGIYQSFIESSSKNRFCASFFFTFYSLLTFIWKFDYYYQPGDEQLDEANMFF